MEVNKDIFDNIPEVGDIIVFNPPKYKGINYGTCIGFTNAGCPKIGNLNWEHYRINYEIKEKGFYSVKTSFIIKKV